MGQGKHFLRSINLETYDYMYKLDVYVPPESEQYFADKEYVTY